MHRRTFAGFIALCPCVIKFGVAGTSTLLEPGTARSATSVFTVVVGDALGTRDRIGGGRNDCARRSLG